MSTVAGVARSESTAASLQLGHRSQGRRVKNVLAAAVMWTSFLIALIPLAWILFTVLAEGMGLLLRSQWWAQSQANMTARISGGGAVHAIQGTLIQAAITTAISVPIAILTAIYLVEYGRGRLPRTVSFMVDILTGVPSIVAGLFIFAVWVNVLGQQRVAFAVCLALVLLMIPVVVRSTEEMLKLVPNELREASFALGVPKWKTIWSVVLPTAFPGILTGVLLGLARVMGETAPLLILGPYSQFINVNMFGGYMATLPTMINFERTEALPAAIERSWAAALTLILLTLLLNLIGRIVAHFNKVKA